MTIREANYELEKLNNDLNKLIKDKAILECLVQPKSADYSKIVVDGGKHGNMLELYVLKQDLPRWKDLDTRIKRTQDEINNYINWIDNELKILKKYDKVEQLIVYYKEICRNKYSWQQISAMVHYSKDYCRKIYSRYKKIWDIERWPLMTTFLWYDDSMRK